MKQDVKSIKEPSLGHDETRQIHRVAAYAFILNLALAVMKILLAFFSGSLSITAGAIDSGTDAVASLLIYAGVKLSHKKTRSFPQGLYKLENVASVVVALFIFIAGYEIVREVLSQPGGQPRISLLFIILLFAGTLATFLFGQYALRVGRKTESPTMVAEGRHRQVDVLSSLLVVVAATLSYLDISVSLFGITIDQIGAVLVLIFIARAGWELLSDGMRVLLDASLDFDTLNRIRDIIQKEPVVSEIKSVVGRNAGRFRFVRATVTLKTKDLDRAHQVSEKIGEKIRQKISHLENVIILYEPQAKAEIRIAMPLADETGRISAHLGEAPFFGIADIRQKGNEIIKKQTLENPHRSVETAKGIRVAEWLVEQGIDHLGLKEDISKKGPGYVLSNAGVQMHIISAKDMDKAVYEILSA
jgi:cation diffusion facilitator family transporter